MVPGVAAWRLLTGSCSLVVLPDGVARRRGLKLLPGGGDGDGGGGGGDGGDGGGGGGGDGDGDGAPG